MCCYKTLHRNEDGYVVFCKSCGHLHVGYGTVVVTYSIEDFYTFESRINDYCEEYRDHEFPSLKSISVPTHTRSVTLVYSPDDLSALKTILQKAKEKLTLEKLFIFHDN